MPVKKITRSLTLKEGCLPDNLFQGKVYNLKLYLIDTKNHTQICNFQPKIKIQLLSEDKSKLKWIDKNPIKLVSQEWNDEGICNLEIIPNELSSLHNNANFFLKVVSMDSTITDTQSKPFSIVLARFEIKSLEFLYPKYPDFETEGNIFFNQLGGKKACIKLLVQLRGATDKSLKNLPDKIDIKYSLVYHSNSVVATSTKTTDPIFDYLGTSPCVISRNDKDAGKPYSKYFSFRINEVSSRHKDERFGILISPNTMKDPSRNDIGSVTSDSILVKAKPLDPGRRKLKRKRNNSTSRNSSNYSSNSSSNTSGMVDLNLMKSQTLKQVLINQREILNNCKNEINKALIICDELIKRKYIENIQGNNNNAGGRSNSVGNNSNSPSGHQIDLNGILPSGWSNNYQTKKKTNDNNVFLNDIHNKYLDKISSSSLQQNDKNNKKLLRNSSAESFALLHNQSYSLDPNNVFLQSTPLDSKYGTSMDKLLTEDERTSSVVLTTFLNGGS